MNLQEMTKDELVAHAAKLQRALTESKENQARLREAEEALRESEAKYRELVQNANSIILRWNCKGEVTFLNEFGQNFFGYSEEEIVGQHVVGTIVPETESGGRDLRPLMEQICANPRGFEHNVNENMLRDGSRVWIEWTNKAIFDDRSQLVEIFSVGTDITERKRSEQASRDSEQRYRLLADNTLDVIWQTDLDLRFTYVNPAIFQVTGYTPDEWIGTRLTEHCDEENFMKMAQVASEEISKGADSSGPIFESVMLKKNKEPISVEIHGRVILGENGLPIALQGVTRDITDRKRAAEGLRKSEAQLRASQEQFQAYMDNSPIIAFMRDDQGRYIYVNRLFLTNNNLSSSKVLGKTANEIFPDEMARKVTKVDLNVMASNSAVTTIESLVNRAGDQREWWLFRFPVRDADGRTYVGGVGLDLTERIKTQKALEVSEARFRQIYEMLPLMVHSADRDGVIRNVNRRWLSHMGYDREEVVGHSLDDFIARELGAEPSLARSQLWAKGTASNVQRRYVKKDGSIVDSVLDSIIIDDPVLGRVSLTAVNDITALKRAEDEIKKSLEEKEVLLREINHRVKNNLQVMSSLVRLQARQVTADNCNQALQETQNRLQTIGLIHEMLHQSRNLAYINVEVYLKRLVANLFSLYGAKSSRIKTTIYAQESRLGVDKADPLGLIANELVSNCLKHAFPDGRKGIIRISLAVESNEFELTVSDNGVGLREDFDPCTAQTLGLVLVNTLVKQLNGVMSVKRTAETKFLIRFPVST